MTPEQFPTLRKYAEHIPTFDATVEAIASAMTAGQVRAPQLQEFKYVIGRAAEKAWDEEVDRKHFHRMADHHSDETLQLYYTCRIMNTHEVLLVDRKLSKSRLQDVAVQAMRSVVAEALPLAQAIADLKGKLLKGRLPSSRPEAPPNPDKVMQTCSCCFRQIAVAPTGKMAHHGYKRPGPGRQTSSCDGIRFPPLEVSCEGLEWLIGSTSAQLEQQKAAYLHRHERTEITLLRKRKLVPITPEHPDWQRELGYLIETMEREIKALIAMLASLQAALATWKEHHSRHNSSPTSQQPPKESP